jgi:hypothetical protein
MRSDLSQSAAVQTTQILKKGPMGPEVDTRAMEGIKKDKN